jgi:hypothetical protein
MRTIYPIMETDSVSRFNWQKIARTSPFVVILLLWFGAAVFGVTSSSLQLNFGDGPSNSATVLVGTPRPIRGDEWVRSTPYMLGRLQPGWSTTSKTPFEAGNKSDISSVGEKANRIVRFEQVALEQVGVFKSFVLLWWLPTVGVLLFGFLLFRQVGLSRKASWLGPVMICLSGSVVWWSMSPLEIFYPAFAGSFFLIRAVQAFSHEKGLQHRLRNWLIYSMLSALFLVRLPFLYVPWSIPIALISGVFVLLALIPIQNIKKFLKSLSIFTLVLIVLGYVLYEAQRGKIEVLLNTVYPGQRRSSGGSNYLSNLLTWSGPYTWTSQNQIGEKVINSNLSEMSRGLTILLIPSLLLLISTFRSKFRELRFKLAAGTFAGCVLFLLWATYKWPSSFIIGHLLAFTPSERMAQILGVIVVIPFVIVWDLSHGLPKLKRDYVLILIGIVSVGLLVLHSGQNLKESFTPALTSSHIWKTVGVCVVIYLLMNFIKPIIFVLLISAAMLVSVYRVNPITVGPGDLLKSEAAHEIATIRASDKNGRWSSDDLFTDALVAASGAPMLSGQQTWGPDRETWKAFDPLEEDIDIWNRGGSFVITRWELGILEPKFESPQSDLLLVTVDPCSETLSKFNVRFIMSSRPLEADCLTILKVVKWTGIDRWIYQRGIPA